MSISRNLGRGTGRFTGISPSNICTTADIDGLCSGMSLMHQKATCNALSTSSGSTIWVEDGSTSSIYRAAIELGQRPQREVPIGLTKVGVHEVAGGLEIPAAAHDLQQHHPKAVDVDLGRDERRGLRPFRRQVAACAVDLHFPHGPKSTSQFRISQN